MRVIENDKCSVVIFTSLLLISLIAFSINGFADLGEQTYPLGQGYTTEDCSLLEVKKINDAYGILLDIVTTGSVNFQKCLNIAPMIEYSGLRAQVSLDILEALRLQVTTKIQCYNAPQNVLADAPVSISGESMRIDHGFLSSGSARSIAATMAHEIMHNRGYSHKENDFGSKYYSNTVPEQVEACVDGGSPNPTAGPKAIVAEECWITVWWWRKGFPSFYTTPYR